MYTVDEKFYPIELFHWIGMGEDFLDDVKIILTKHPEYLNLTNTFDDNVFSVASRLGNLKVVEYLANDTNVNIHYKNDQGNAFTIATQYNQLPMALYLKSLGLDIDTPGVDGKTPLFFCAFLGLENLLEELIEQGANIHHLDNNYQHVLFPLIQEYAYNKNYYSFELIEPNLNNDILFKKNKSGLNIIEYMYFLINRAEEENNLFRKQKLIDVFTPLLAILKSRQSS